MYKKKFYIKRKNLLLLILILIIPLNLSIISQLHRFSLDLNRNQEISIESEDLKINGPAINITTPENKTYTEPMRGYYPATYGFENDEDGIEGTNISYIDIYEVFADTYVKIVAEEDGHKKVIEIYDDNSDDDAAFNNNFSSSQISGSIEFWFKNVDNMDTFSLGSLWDGAILCIQIQSNNGIIRTYDGSWHTICSYDSDTWYHVKITFECGSGGYDGLEADDFNFYLDGTKCGSFNFRNAGVSATHTRFASTTGGTPTCYLDAVGYSWDPNYHIGDNLNEGLLLSYENNMSLEWQGYSLDGQINKTIIGNKSIPFPTQDGGHTIQVFGNNSGGVMYESEVRYFSTQIFNIITPENITYTAPMSGYYPGTYGFENDEDGSEPLAWDINGGGGSCSIISSEGGHNKVMECYDNDTVDAYVTVIDTFTDQSSGTVEWWWRTTDNTAISEFILTEDMIYAVQLQISSGNLIYIYSGDNTIVSFNNNTWYHIKVDFECGGGGYKSLSADTYYVHVNEVQYGPYNFRYSVNNINNVKIYSNEQYTNYYAYYDAIGYSWDPNYHIGDNLNEGLLLSYENSTSLEWQGYSLDGQANKTIIGNTSIPFPTQDGGHIIQVFGNNSGGVMYESEVRYFTIDTYMPPIPYLNIISPENITYIEPMSSLFLSFETNIILDWIGYSLDSQINITIMGNTSIPMPSDGIHFIQIFGNNSGGVMYESNIQYYTIDTTAPIIVGIDTIIELEQFSYYSLDWTIIDISGGTYTILKNNTIESAGSFQNNDQISIIVDTDKVGYLSYNIIAIDTYDKVSSHIVIVKVFSEEEPNPNIPGFNALILFAVVSVTTGIIMKSKFKNKK